MPSHIKMPIFGESTDDITHILPISNKSCRVGDIHSRCTRAIRTRPVKAHHTSTSPSIFDYDDKYGRKG